MSQGLLPKSQDDRIFSHFTNAKGVGGIAGIDAKNMKATLKGEFLVTRIRA